MMRKKSLRRVLSGGEEMCQSARWCLCSSYHETELHLCPHRHDGAYALESRLLPVIPPHTLPVLGITCAGPDGTASSPTGLQAHCLLPPAQLHLPNVLADNGCFVLHRIFIL